MALRRSLLRIDKASFLYLNCWIFQIKMLYWYVKDSFAVLSINSIKIFSMFQKNSVDPKPFYPKSFLLSIVISLTHSASKVSKCGIFSGLCFPVFGLNTEKCRPGNTLHLDAFHAVKSITHTIKYRCKNRSKHHKKWSLLTTNWNLPTFTGNGTMTNLTQYELS